MRKVEVSIEVMCPPERAIRAFTEFKMLKDWWGVERCLIDKKVGGVYTLSWGISKKGMAFVSSGIISKFNATRQFKVNRFVYLNSEKEFLGPMSLEVRVTRMQKGCKLYICQDGYGSGSKWNWYYRAVQTAWPMVAMNLKSYLESARQ